MDLFTKLFDDFLLFVYHCFDRIVIRGYLTALSHSCNCSPSLRRDCSGAARSSLFGFTPRPCSAPRAHCW